MEYKWIHTVTKETLTKVAYFEKVDDVFLACGFYKK